MSAAKKLGLVLLAVLLVGTAGASNIVMTSERTVLNAGFVDQSMAEENGYTQVQEFTVDAVVDEVNQANPASSDQVPQQIQQEINATELVDSAVTESYIRNQSRANLYRLYDYLHGDRQRLNFTVDLEPLKASLADAVGQQVKDVDLGALVDAYVPTDGNLPVEVTGDRLARMRANESGYMAVRAQFRDEVRSILYDRLRQDNPSILLEAIGINPDQYSSDAERRQAVDRHEQEIRRKMEELTAQGKSNDIKERFDRELADRADQAKDRVRQETRQQTSDYSANVTQAAINLQVAIIDGLATDTSYQEFSTRIDSAETALADEASRLARQRINEEVPDSISAADRLSQNDRQQIDELAGRIQQADTVNTLLPIAALVLVGLVYVLSRQFGTTLLTTGVALALTGIASYAGSIVAEGFVTDQIRTQISGDNAQALQDIAIGLVEQVLGVLKSQSLLLLVAGVVLLALAFATKKGYFDNLRGGTSGAAAGAGAGGAGRTGGPGETAGQSGTAPPPSEQPGQPGRRREQAGPDLGDDTVEPLDVGGDDADGQTGPAARTGNDSLGNAESDNEGSGGDPLGESSDPLGGGESGDDGGTEADAAEKTGDSQ